MVIIWVPDAAVTFVALAAFSLSLIWQLVQFIVIRRQRKASSTHLEAWNYKG